MPLSAHGGARGQVMPDIKQEVADALARAVSDAITHGLTTEDIDEITQMVAAQQPQPLDDVARHMAEDSERGELPLYAEAPPGMIDLPTVARVYGINARTAKGWIVRGQLQVLGKVQGPGSPRYLVCEETIAKMAQQPKNKGGRSRKT